MFELTDREFWLISVYFQNNRGFGGSHYLHDLFHYMIGLACRDSKQIVNSLIDKNVLSLSPDRRSIKFTDYGLELFTAMKRAQKEWEAQPIIRISNLDRDQILIHAGEAFRANRVLREIIQEVQTEICVIDAYLGSEIFDLLEDTNPHLRSRLLASDRAPKTLIPAYKAYRRQYGTAELRITDENKIHDRYILWDNQKALHFGHSLKDLGKKDTQINVVKDTRPQFQLFEDRWTNGKVPA